MTPLPGLSNDLREVFRSPAAGLLGTPASARRFGTVELTVNDGGGAADSGVDRNRPERVIFGASTAFLATVQIDDPRLAALNVKHDMGADLGVQAAIDNLTKAVSLREGRLSSAAALFGAPASARRFDAV